MPETTLPPGAPKPVDLMRVAALVLTARQDNTDGLVARARLVEAVGGMVAEIGTLRQNDGLTARAAGAEKRALRQAVQRVGLE